MIGLSHGFLDPAIRLPLLIQPRGRVEALADLVCANKTSLDEILLEHGAILFRGFNIGDAIQFGEVTNAIGSERLDYVYRSTPRAAVGDGVFTATEYPADQEIELHNENAYQHQWPLKIAFCCVAPAAVGGETPLADVRNVSARIGAALLERFEVRGVKYSRTYQQGADLPWQEVFQSTDKAQVETYCRANGISHEWIDAEVLRTHQVSQGAATHPVTGERFFFNQAHLFHVSSMGEAAAAAMLSVFGRGRLPRHACYGDGEEIGFDELETIRRAYREEAVSFRWSRGDVLFLDNMRVAHGRRPYKGSRRLLASLLDAYRPNREGSAGAMSRQIGA